MLPLQAADPTADAASVEPDAEPDTSASTIPGAAHWVGFVCMEVPQVPPSHPRQGENDRYRSITHDSVVADHQNYTPLDSP